MKYPFFSVCINSHNRSKTITETLHSVLNQKFRDFEVIIVDYGSTDNTREVVKRFFRTDAFKENRFEYKFIKINKKLVSVEDWNEPLKYAKGKYISMLEGDDRFLPEYLMKAHEVLSQRKNIGIYATGNQYKKRGKAGTFCSKEYFQMTYSLTEIPAPSQTIFVSHNQHNKKFNYNIREYIYAPEIELYLNIVAEGYDAYHDDFQLVWRDTKFKHRTNWRYYRDHFHVINKYNNHHLTSKGSRYKASLLLCKRYIHNCLRRFIIFPVMKNKISILLQEVLFRVLLSYRIIASKKYEPYYSIKILLIYLVTGHIYPYKKYNNYKKLLTVRTQKEWKILSYSNKKFAYPGTWSEDLIKENFNAILNEQSNKYSNESPHKYLKNQQVKKEWIIYDLGAAEGFQSKVWAKVAYKLIILEPDISFYNALKLTFSKEIRAKKVIVINKGVSDTKKEISIDGKVLRLDALDNIIKEHKLEYPHYIKADLEGEEINFLKGAKEVFVNNNIEQIDITVYHRPTDSTVIPQRLSIYPGRGQLSEGIMLFNRDGFVKGSWKKLYSPIIRKCLYSYVFKK